MLRPLALSLFLPFYVLAQLTDLRQAELRLQDVPRRPSFSPNTPFSSPDSLPKPVFGEGFGPRVRSPPGHEGREMPRVQPPGVETGPDGSEFEGGSREETLRRPPQAKIVGMNLQMIAGFYPNDGAPSEELREEETERSTFRQRRPPSFDGPHFGVPGPFPRRDFSRNRQDFQAPSNEHLLSREQQPFPGIYSSSEEGYRNPESGYRTHETLHPPPHDEGRRVPGRFSPLEGAYEEEAQLRPGAQRLGNPYPKDEERRGEFRGNDRRSEPHRHPEELGRFDGDREESHPPPAREEAPSRKKFYFSPYAPYKQTLPDDAYYSEDEERLQRPEPLPQFPPFRFPNFIPFSPLFQLPVQFPSFENRGFSPQSFQPRRPDYDERERLRESSERENRSFPHHRDSKDSPETPRAVRAEDTKMEKERRERTSTTHGLSIMEGMTTEGATFRSERDSLSTTVPPVFSTFQGTTPSSSFPPLEQLKATPKSSSGRLPPPSFKLIRSQRFRGVVVPIDAPSLH